MTVASTVDPSQLYYTLPGVTDADKVLLKDYVGIPPDYPRWSSYVEPLTEKATEILDDLGLALICESVRSAIAAYLVRQKAPSDENDDPVARSKELFSNMRRRAIGTNLRYSGDHSNPQFFVPSGLFGKLPEDVQLELLAEAAEEANVANLWLALEYVGVGENNMWPKAQLVCGSFSGALATVLEKHFSLKEVDTWTDGVPSGYEANEMQLEVLKAKTIWPPSVEKETFESPKSILWRAFDSKWGKRRPHTIKTSRAFPRTSGDTVKTLRDRKSKALMSKMTEFLEYLGTQDLSTMKKHDRTWSTLVLRHPGSFMLSHIVSCADRGTDLYDGFAPYINEIPDKKPKTKPFVPFHFPSTMFRQNDIPGSGHPLVPLCHANTGTYHLYDSHGHRGWTKPLVKEAVKFAKYIETRSKSTKTQDTPEVVLDVEDTEALRGDATDASFESDTETVGDKGGDSTSTTLKVPETPTTAKLPVRGRHA